MKGKRAVVNIIRTVGGHLCIVVWASGMIGQEIRSVYISSHRYFMHIHIVKNSECYKIWS